MNIITYNKGQVKTSAMVPTSRNELLGSGDHGKVYAHRFNDSWAVKKSEESLKAEFLIGQRLDHPSFVKVHMLFIKKYPDREVHKMVMDRVEGTTLTKIKENKLLKGELLIKVLTQLKECCLHLFDKEVCWVDLYNLDNFLINEEGKLTCLDFEDWKIAKNPVQKSQHLYMMSQRLVFLLLEDIKDYIAISFQKNDPLFDMQIQEQRNFLEDFFDRAINNVTLYNNNCSLGVIMKINSYVKGKIPTRELVPTCRDKFLGAGTTGTVYTHRDNPLKAVNKRTAEKSLTFTSKK